MTEKKFDYFINGEKGKWEVIIGLEVHAQVLSKSKLFSGSSTKFGADPNNQVSLIDSAFPGMLPVINEEIAKILSNIVDFEIFFETSDKKLEIYIKHSKYGPRPIELGSGAEKTIASMAIRLALLSVSNLPKADLFVLDEPGTALDEDNMEGFIRILTDMIKTQFKTVLLISHLDSLKDCVDMTIDIDKVDGLAHINQ